MHINDMTIKKLKNAYAESSECASMCRDLGKHYRASMYEREAAAMLARINELEAAREESDKLRKETP